MSVFSKLLAHLGDKASQTDSKNSASELELVALEERLLYSASPMAELAAASDAIDAELTIDDIDPTDLSGLESQFDELTRLSEALSQQSESIDTLPRLALGLTSETAFSMSDEVNLSGNDGEFLEFAHNENLELGEGTIALSFVADDIFERNALISKDADGKGSGHITAYVNDGRIVVKMQSERETVWLTSQHGSVRTGESHHLAVTFGDDGLWLYLDGKLTDWNTDFTEGIEGNSENLLIGASGEGRTPNHPTRAWNEFDGTISNVVILDSQYDRNEVAVLSGNPPPAPLESATVIDGVLQGSDDGERGATALRATNFGVNQVHGGYGNDTIIGTNGNDIIDGGHGEDRLYGGRGDDLLISRSDGREAYIAQDYDQAEDDPDNEINPRTRTHYANQPIEADDILMGGAGADTFRFEVLINAKEDIILDHVMDNGMIHWHGVAGENDQVHDHWVDRIGNEVIRDFSRAEGDKIEIVGHTIDLYKIEHQDSNGNGILDSTVLYLQSNQGNAGAHNKDQIGTITVLGDLVMESDIFVDAAPAYGIVDTIHELDEAVAPRIGTPYRGVMPTLPNPNDGELPDDAIFGVNNPIDLTGDHGDHIEVAHNPDMQLHEGTIALTFNADDIWGRHALFSKDFTDNRDGGDITAYVQDGRIYVRLQSAESDVWLKSQEGSIAANQDYHMTVTFGDDGFWLYLNGKMTDWNTDFTQGLEDNTQNLIIGANGWGRTADHPYKAWDHFDGTIGDFVILDSQYDRNEVAVLSGNPPPAPLESATVIDGVLQGSDDGERGATALRATNFGVNQVHGGYGNDTIIGTNGNDIIDGGHGEDRLYGGRGDDLLISRSDGREAYIAQDYDQAEDDPDNEINPRTRTHYANQPIEADDILMGGAGADTFRFEVLINAKEDIILDHVMDNGMIHWHGVAGENDQVHDHWVDRIGNEVIRDFSRAEGDKIEIVGHTIDLYKIEHQDSNGNGILDSTVLYLQSNQGNAGAHNKDQIGTITVLGDLVMESDIFVDAAPAYGIVDTIHELDEAVAPRIGTPYRGVMPTLPNPNDGELPDDAIFGVNNPIDLTGDHGDHIEVAHNPDMQLHEGTIALTFNADDIWGRHALFSKDFTDNRDGGDITAYVQDGRIYVRLQSAESDVWLKSQEGSIAANQDYHMTVTFGDDGFWLYLNGKMTDWNTDFTQGLEDNTQNLIIGANGWGRTADHPYKAWDHFDGTIGDFVILDSQYDRNEVAVLSGNPPPAPLESATVIDGVLQGSDDGERGATALRATNFGVNQVHGGYGNDTIIGTNGNDIIDGGHGEDRLYGGRGDDLLISRSDGREAYIAQDYDQAEDDPDNEINPRTRTHYANQPIEADDILMGGAGADTFRFEVLINAKEDIILDHVMDNGMIHWHGVAGENDQVHDHWVDRIGNEVIRDFSRAEGDKIEIVGHTIDLYKIEHQDSNGNGILDSTVLYLQSNQGNAGAHNKDQIGTITVLGDLVMESDIFVDAAPAYGIVDTIHELDEAVAPRIGTPYRGVMPTLPNPNDGELPDDAVLGLTGSIELSGDSGDHIEVAHDPDLRLDNGTIALSFNADDIWGRHALFSKDFSDNRDGGDITAYIEHGRLFVRLQTATESTWLSSQEGAITEGTTYQVAVTFGDGGFLLYLNGQIIDLEAGHTEGLGNNTQNLAIGASTWSRTTDRPLTTSDEFDGTISNFLVFDRQYSASEIAALAF